MAAREGLGEYAGGLLEAMGRGADGIDDDFRAPPEALAREVCVCARA